jgi:hypothetical protein
MEQDFYQVRNGLFDLKDPVNRISNKFNKGHLFQIQKIIYKLLKK